MNIFRRVLGASVAVFFLISLHGCQALNRVRLDQQQDGLDLTRPNLPVGQKAYVSGYFDRALANAWRETNLFSSVEVTTSDVPPASGFYVRTVLVRCWEGNSRTGAAGTMLQFFTLGLIPDPAIVTTSCYYYASVFNDGTQLLKERPFTAHFEYLGGWYALAMDEDDALNDVARKLVKQEISDINQRAKK